MKKNIVYLLVLLVLLAIAGYFISNYNESGSLERKTDYAFTISDTASISKIVISDKEPSEVTLEKVNGSWRVNGEYQVRPDAIQTLLTTLYRMEMRNFVPEDLQETVIKRMTVFGKEVKVYKEGKLFKTFYVGTETHDEMATYMMIKNSDQPFAVHIPGFNGYLSSRFFTQSELWRKRVITDIKPREIKKVEVLYPDSLDNSFVLHVFSPDSLYIEDAETGRVVNSINKMKARIYLNAVAQMRYEGAIVPTDPIWQRRDSLLASTPVFELTVKDIDGKTTNLQGYAIKGDPDTFDPELTPKAVDPDRLHGFIDEKQMVLLQYYGLNNVLKGKSYFTQQ